MSDIHDDFGNTVPKSAQKHFTPNVVISNPDTRRIITTVISVLGVVVGAAVAVDLASPELEYSAITTPINALVVFLAGAFGLAVTRPNTPTK